MFEYADGELGTDDVLKIERAIIENKELRMNFHVNKSLDEFMKVNFLLEQIKKEPTLPEIEMEMKSEFSAQKDLENFAYASYINGALKESSAIEKQIIDAESEMNQSELYPEMKEWVESYMNGKNKSGEIDKHTSEIQTFIKKGVDSHNAGQINIPVNAKKKKIIYRIAAVAAVLIIAIGFWTVFNSKTSKDDLFISYYKPYEISSDIVRGNTQNDEKLNLIIAQYKKGDYENTAIQLELIINNENNSQKVFMMYGISQMELNNYNSAIQNFEKIVSSGADFTIEAKWYLALCYLKTNKINDSKKLLIELSKTPGFYKAKAIDLLSEL
jgi:tetratricopeptide (TPR) repeat protein